MMCPTREYFPVNLFRTPGRWGREEQWCRGSVHPFRLLINSSLVSSNRLHERANIKMYVMNEKVAMAFGRNRFASKFTWSACTWDIHRKKKETGTLI